MERLTESLKPLPNNTFCFCQICGCNGTDICEFRMWAECDELDVPEEQNVFITCKSDECLKIVDSHQRLYVQVPWGRGGISKLIVGQFMLTCGDCKWRKGFSCRNNKQKTVGGEGLEVKIADLPMFFCISKGKNKGFHSVYGNPPVSSCAEYEKIKS